MNAIFKKLNLKSERTVVVIHAPESFETVLTDLADVAVCRDLDTAAEPEFILAFAENQAGLTKLAETIIPRTPDDIPLWFAYPKKSSKRYKSDITRDSGWEVLGEAGFEGVRQVALDEDWSALRFRRVAFIKSFTRDPKRALSKEGRARSE